jgi:long-chain acyl-CoA synthetase
MWATPTHLNMIVSTENVKDRNIANLRAIQYSGAPLSSGLFYKVRDIFGSIDLVNAYGMTELDSVSAIYPEEHDRHLGSVGRALPKTFVRIVEPNKGNPDAGVNRGEVGEIIVRSPCVMKEYWHLPEKTNEVIKKEWYFTGDLGRMDGDGYLYFVEREDDMIISGGENIYLLEVENVISKKYGETDDIPPEMIKAMADAWLFQLLLPEDLGGKGVKALPICLAREELAGVYCPADVTMAMQGLGSYPIFMLWPAIKGKKGNTCQRSALGNCSPRMH